MKLLVATLTVAFAAITSTAGAQTPRLSNGRIESHATTNIAKEKRFCSTQPRHSTW